MAFTLPTLSEIREQTATDLETYLPGSDARTRRTATGVLSYAVAGAVLGLHANIQARERNFLPDEQADAEGVERWAGLLRIWYREASAAEGSLLVTGTVGATLPAGSVLQHTDGTVYSTQADLTLSAGSGSVTVKAAAAGAAGNLPAASRLTLLSPVLGINSALEVGAGGLAGGADRETPDSLRARVLERLRNPPMGGSTSDYETWALEGHAAVTRAWVSSLEQGANTVTVRVVCDNEADIIPTQSVLDAVAAYIEGERPVTAEVFVVAPVAAPVVFRIGLVPDTAAVRAVVATALQDLLRREAAPGGTLLRSHVAEAISVSVGETDHELVYPAGNLTHAAGEMPTFGGIEWL